MPSKPTLIEECSKILGCKPKHLIYELFHPKSRSQILEKLQGCIVQTTYCDRFGYTKTLPFDGLTANGAHKLLAYGRLSLAFNCSVSAHFYSRHRIRLRYPYLPCVVEKYHDSIEERYYPLELLEMVDEVEKPEEKYFGKLFTEIKKEDPPEKSDGGGWKTTTTHIEINMGDINEEEEEEEEEDKVCSLCGDQHDVCPYCGDIHMNYGY